MASPLPRLLLLTALLAHGELRAQDFLDRLDQNLTVSAFDAQFRARLSGTLDLEFYAFDQPAPGLIDSRDSTLFNPRLSLFVDSQIGSRIYFFSQIRVDRHFDPTDQGVQIRLDEYALRVTPWEDGRFSLQVGKFPSDLGNWNTRHLSWDNPFINAPLAYENATPLSDLAAPYTYGIYDGQKHGPKYVYLPVIWGPSYASGLSIAGRVWKFEYAAAVKNAALASRPESWDLTRIDFDYPTVSGRLGFRPNPMWNFGVSASDGAYLRSEAGPTLPRGRSIGDFHEIVLGQDITFAWHHLQIWAEFYEARFEAPILGDADTFTYYVEAKYKFTPQFFGAVRWGQQFFSKVPDAYGGEIPWSSDIWRIEGAVGYRFTPHTQLKLEYYFQHEDDPQLDSSHTFAAQLTVRF